MKRPTPATTSTPLRAAPPSELDSLYPLLADHLTALTYDGEPPTPRQTSTLLLFAQDGTYRACLRDRQEARCLWVSVVDPNDLLTTLELALSDPTAVWREDRMSGAESARRIPNPKKVI